MYLVRKQLPGYCKFLLLIITVCFSAAVKANTNKVKPEFYQIRIYHFRDSAQEKILDTYLQNAFLPAIHKAGINKAGIFKAIANDTAADKLLYVFITLKSTEHLLKLSQQLGADAVYQAAARDYIDAAYKNPPYSRMESILLKAFSLAPQMQIPGLKALLNERIYELRSYESATEKKYRNKVQMFNEGGEINLFKRLDFNAVFYAEVISGSHMPNLMYMTSFENKTVRDAHWKAFGEAPEWKKLSSLPEYQDNVSHIDIVFLRATAYSDF